MGDGKIEKSTQTTIHGEKLGPWVFRSIAPLVQEMNEEVSVLKSTEHDV